LTGQCRAYLSLGDRRRELGGLLGDGDVEAGALAEPQPLANALPAISPQTASLVVADTLDKHDTLFQIRCRRLFWPRRLELGLGQWHCRE
jgi:hypothetical protein